MPTVRLGLSGFADPVLQRTLYAPGTPPSDYLRQYAERFDLYEVAPAAEPGFTRAHAEGLLEQAPSHLRLLPRLPTGPTPGQVQDWGDRLQPLLRNHRCGPAPMAWPEAWSADSEARLAGVLDRLSDVLPASGRVAVEFLHGSWLRPSALRLLSEHEAALVWSTRAGTVPMARTADFVYIRLTGIHHRRCRDEVAAFLERLRARSDDPPALVVSTRSGEPYGLHALERFARGVGRPLDLGPRTAPGQAALDRFGVPA